MDRVIHDLGFVALAAALAGCGGSTTHQPQAAKAAAIAPAAGQKPARSPGDTPTTETKAKPTKNATAGPGASTGVDLGDLDRLCDALNRDYVDGTLSNTFAGLALRSAKGQAVRVAADEADQPGRFVLAEVERVSPGAKAPPLASCRKLLDDIDDIE